MSVQLLTEVNLGLERLSSSLANGTCVRDTKSTLRLDEGPLKCRGSTSPSSKKRVWLVGGGRSGYLVGQSDNGAQAWADEPWSSTFHGLVRLYEKCTTGGITMHEKFDLMCAVSAETDSLHSRSEQPARYVPATSTVRTIGHDRVGEWPAARRSLCRRT